jgi:hypothetical protein
MRSTTQRRALRGLSTTEEEEERMPTATAAVTTERPVAYMRQLCKHFAHKTTARYADAQGYIVLGGARCELDASAAGELLLTAFADDEPELERVKRVIGSHLERFGRRDGLTVDWHG